MTCHSIQRICERANRHYDSAIKMINKDRSRPEGSTYKRHRNS